MLCATSSNGLSGETYAFDVISSGILGSATHSPDETNSASGIVWTLSHSRVVITYVSPLSIAFKAQSANLVANMRSAAVVSPARWVCYGNAVRCPIPAADKLRAIMSAGRPE